MNIENLVHELVEGMEQSTKHLFTDNFYTSIPLGKHLL